jgi:ComF family protein
MISSRILDSFLTILYPQACSICEESVESRSNGSICESCWSSTEIFSEEDSLCEKCGAFLQRGRSKIAARCRRCGEDFYDKAAALGAYKKALMVSVLALKRSPEISPRLRSEIIKSFGKTDFQDATKVIPVPLSKRRLRGRGFNQAAVIARIIADEFGMVLDANSLVRNAATEKHRMGMDYRARRESVAKIFEVARPKLIEGERIVVVDDVFTTGATTSQCAKILKESGAEKVYVFTLARAGS